MLSSLKPMIYGRYDLGSPDRCGLGHHRASDGLWTRLDVTQGLWKFFQGVCHDRCPATDGHVPCVFAVMPTAWHRRGLCKRSKALRLNPSQNPKRCTIGRTHPLPETQRWAIRVLGGAPKRRLRLNKSHRPVGVLLASMNARSKALICV